jgi:peroxiredoxin
MNSTLKSRWQRFRSHFWLSLAFDAALILAVFLGIHAWQTRDLPLDESAPVTVLRPLEGGAAQTAVHNGEAGVVYFFAPWCFYCRTSIDNLQDLVDSGSVAWATAVALDYGDEGEVREFVADTGLRLPVLMGSRQTAADWSVRAFPTYYVIDAEGRISSRSVGYSTQLGMWFRSWRARM